MKDHMTYQKGMEGITSTIMDQVLAAYAQYTYDHIGKKEVTAVLQKERLTPEDFGVLLSPAAQDLLEEMAVRAQLETKKQFGTSVTLFTPLYLSNYCSNECLYCGFNCKNKIARAKLTFAEMEQEYKAIAATGLKEILLLTGESRTQSEVSYIAKAIQLAKQYFTTIGIEIYPLNTAEYQLLHESGADFVSVYQETYDTTCYERFHPAGPKRSFPYRFNAQERALMGGMRGVSVGCLAGLSDFRKDAFAAGLHAFYLQQKYPHGEIAFSVPRMRPHGGESAGEGYTFVTEGQLLQIMLAYRIFLPFAGITISTRERGGFRDHCIGLAANKMSAGVKTGIGGHETEQKGDEQFAISDERDVNEICQMLTKKGMQPVYSDYIPLM